MAPARDVAVVMLLNRNAVPTDLAIDALSRFGDLVYDPPHDATPVATWGEYAGTYRDAIGTPTVPAPRDFVVSFDGTDLWMDIDGVLAELTPEYSAYAGGSFDQDVFTFTYGGTFYQVRFYRDGTTGVPTMISGYFTRFGPAAFRVP